MHFYLLLFFFIFVLNVFVLVIVCIGKFELEYDKIKWTVKKKKKTLFLTCLLMFLLLANSPFQCMWALFMFFSFLFHLSLVSSFYCFLHFFLFRAVFVVVFLFFNFQRSCFIYSISVFHRHSHRFRILAFISNCSSLPGCGYHCYFIWSSSIQQQSFNQITILTSKKKKS